MVFRKYPISITLSAGAVNEDTEFEMTTSDGVFSLHLESITGDGTFKVEVLGSNTGSNFTIADGCEAVKTGLTKDSGDDGNILLPINDTHMIPALDGKLRFTETGETDIVVIQGALIVR